MENLKTIADPHCHITDGYDLVWKTGVPFFGGNYYYGLQPKRDFSKVLFRSCADKALNQGSNTLIGLVNFDDERAQRIIESLRRDAESYEQNFCWPLLTINHGSRKICFLAGQEIRTEKGDVLLLGAPKNLEERKLEEVLKRARTEYNALILGCHLGMPGSLNFKELEIYRDYFDAVDSQNDLGLPVYRASDSHTLRGVFSAYTIFENLDFTNAESMKDSIRRDLQKNPEIKGKGCSSRETLRHLASVFPWIIFDQFNKRGLGFLSPMKRDYE